MVYINILEKLKALTDEYEQRISNMRLKLQEDLTNEKHFDIEERRKLETSIREEYSKKLAMKDQQMNELKRSFDQERAVLQNKINSEYELVNKKLNVEKQGLEQKLRYELEIEYKKREDDMKKILTKQRDQQIDNILTKLTEETNNKVISKQDEYERTIKSLKSTYQIEMNGKNDEIDSLKKKISIQEGIINNNDKNVRGLEKRLEDANDKLSDRLNVIQSLESRLREHEVNVNQKATEATEPLLKQIKQLQLVF